jgi:phosphoribosylformylglycinamidine synthase PurS subunit
LRARIIVRPRREILDPQGKAIRNALERSGFAGVLDVRAGKSFEIEFDDPAPVEAQAFLRRMCDSLLVNAVVEDFEIELLPQAAEAKR